MPAIHLEDLSSFGRLAVKLDGEFAELSRLSGQLDRLDIDSDSGLDRAVKLLTLFAQHGTNIADGIQDFARVLQEARDRSEAAAKAVGERAQLIAQRKQHQNGLREKLTQVEQNVSAANATLTGFRKEGGRQFSTQEKDEIKSRLEALNVDLKRFLAEAQAVKDEAAGAKFKNIERDAQALIDALRSSTRQVDKVIPKGTS